MPVILKPPINYEVTWSTLCNYALAKLGADSITDLSEGSRNAELCTRFLPKAIEHVLSQYDFNFARTRMRLAPLAERPVFGWKYQYTLPVGLLRIIKVYGGYTDLPIDNDRVRYQIEGGRLLTDEDGIEILYIERPVSAATMPYHFVDAVVAYLAYLMAIVITSSEQITALMARESERQIEAAKRMDAQQNYAPEEDGERWYTEAR